MLTQALLHLEASTPDHGIPRWLASDSDRRFDVDEHMDYAAEALARVTEEYRRGEADTKGLTLSVRDLGPRPD